VATMTRSPWQMAPRAIAMVRGKASGFRWHTRVRRCFGHEELGKERLLTVVNNHYKPSKKHVQGHNCNHQQRSRGFN
jgi:hypothetical protein